MHAEVLEHHREVAQDGPKVVYISVVAITGVL